MRQVIPSVVLFTLVIELLANTMREDKEIGGIGCKEKKQNKCICRWYIINHYGSIVVYREE